MCALQYGVRAARAVLAVSCAVNNESERARKRADEESETTAEAILSVFPHSVFKAPANWPEL